ncbi:Spermatogenesis- and oogenesis-specific basic helix-loop-helix-containing 2 [Brachionus plicatilis]|uniref:Spermatogenesis-and oogenesis-specific basic helix-loop-helix-containing 2 n=1 Tax=Brachionus plicatilis TaxID=10195 RepID=A0A3M7S2J9_BRAPC|nr:Spermatogenesis- and oogenesis-specific basic helix-loop-helix-containing 2 [Brachionus plicatilis]
MFSKYNPCQSSYQLGNMVGQASDVNNNFAAPKNDFGSNAQGSVCAPNRKMEDEEDDVDSLNINFDDVNEQSDLEEYYNNSPEQVINTNSNIREIGGTNSKTETCLYESPQHFALNPKGVGHQITPCKPNAAARINTNLFMNTPISSPPDTLLDSVLASEFNHGETVYGTPANTKPSNKNIHCIKEKIRRDRIKMSCNQLRKLIPNVGGFKTDTASLLETTVYWTELINTFVPEQYLSIIKAKLASLAAMKMSSQSKNVPSQSPNASFMGHKYKQNFEYLISKNQQEALQFSHDLHMPTNSPHASLNAPYEQFPMDLNHSFSSLPASLNLKPNSWLPYSFQLNHETNNCLNIAKKNANHHHQMMAYNELYDKMIKKSPANNIFN